MGEFAFVFPSLKGKKTRKQDHFGGKNDGFQRGRLRNQSIGEIGEVQGAMNLRQV